MFNEIIDGVRRFFWSRVPNPLVLNPNVQSSGFLDLPDEVLTDIFKRLNYGQDPFNFSLVCFRLSRIAAANMRLVDFLISENCRKILFTQTNRIHTFLTLGSPKNQPEIVITADQEEYDKNPVVTLWTNNQSPFNELTSLFKKLGKVSFKCSYFYKPIYLLEVGGQSDSYLAAAQYNSEGRIQIWDIKQQKVLLEDKLGKEITCLCANKDQLLIGFDDGTAQISLFSDLSLLQEWNVYDSKVNKIFVDSSIQRIFTFSSSSLKIWDSESLECIQELDFINPNNSIYDYKFKYLICGCSKNKGMITLISPYDGTEIATLIDLDKSASLIGMHFDPESGLLFAGFKTLIPWKNEVKLARAKVTVWNIETKELITSFQTFTMPLPEPGLCDIPYHIDFDPKSRLILTGGRTVSLWSLDTGKLVKTLLSGLVRKMIWEKEARRLFLLVNDEVLLLDYSRTPFKILVEDSEKTG